jgi:type IV secretion system protein VirB2
LGHGILTSASSSSLTGAAAWLQGTLLGPIATTIAVIAVASVGFLMLTGRLHWRRGAQTIIGCFILFGASSIAAGIMGVAQPSAADSAQAVPLDFVEPATYAPPSTPAGQAQTVCWTCGVSGNEDPYAGASVRN